MEGSGVRGLRGEWEGLSAPVGSPRPRSEQVPPPRAPGICSTEHRVSPGSGGGGKFPQRGGGVPGPGRAQPTGGRARFPRGGGRGIPKPRASPHPPAGPRLAFPWSSGPCVGSQPLGVFRGHILFFGGDGASPPGSVGAAHTWEMPPPCTAWVGLQSPGERGRGGPGSLPKTCTGAADPAPPGKGSGAAEEAETRPFRHFIANYYFFFLSSSIGTRIKSLEQVRVRVSKGLECKNWHWCRRNQRGRSFNPLAKAVR